jgi:broad specificity phosphatase PhoE
MINIYLIRHGKASAGWNTMDPNLDLKGKEQSDKIALKLSQIAKNPFDIFSSPLIRCIETAEPFSKIKNKKIKIENRVIEIPSPIKNLKKRVVWLKRVLPLTWNELISDKDSMDSKIDYFLWRENILKFFLSLNKDTFIFTHYLVINSVVSHLRKSDKVVFFNPDNTSLTHLSLSDKKLKIISLGDEASTLIN